LTREIIVVPSLFLNERDGLAEQLKINQIAEYLNTHHQFSYIVYNFSDQKPLSGSLSVKNFHQVMDYPFPTAKGPKNITEPPNLDAIFLVAIEMQQWLNH
jgi:hypothetical protein